MGTSAIKFRSFWTCTYPIWRCSNVRKLFDTGSKLACFCFNKMVLAPIHLCGLEIVSLVIISRWFEALKCCENCIQRSGKTWSNVLLWKHKLSFFHPNPAAIIFLTRTCPGSAINRLTTHTFLNFMRYDTYSYLSYLSSAHSTVYIYSCIHILWEKYPYISFNCTRFLFVKRTLLVSSLGWALMWNMNREINMTFSKVGL